MSFDALPLGVAALTGVSGCESNDDEASGDRPLGCTGKCDGFAGGGPVPVVVRSATWDGRVVIGATAGDACRAMAVHPSQIERSGAAVRFEAEAFSDGAPCPSAIGDHAIAAADREDNPYASERDGTPARDGEFLTYAVDVFSTDGDTLVSRAATLTVSNPTTARADVVGFTWSSDAQALTANGQALTGARPTVTTDGGLVVFEHEGGLAYSRRIGDDWTGAAPLTSLHTEGGEEVDGLTLAERYPLAAAPLRDTNGTVLEAGSRYPGAFAWLSHDGTELIHTALRSDEGDELRHGTVVIGQGTGHGVRLVDGSLNPAYQDAAEVGRSVGLGRSQGVFTAFRAENVLPVEQRAAAYPVFSHTLEDGEARGAYHEVDFEAFADRDYLVYLPMNPNLALDGEFGTDPSTTPDISGRFNTATVGEGVEFAELPGEHGYAMDFDGDAMLRMPTSSSLTPSNRWLTVSMFVRRHSDQAHPLMQWQGMAALEILDDGRLQATVQTGGQARVAVSDAPVAVGPWVHVAFTYDGGRGVLRTFVDGRRSSQDVLGRAFMDAPLGDLFVGPGALGGADESVRVSLDEVAVSRVARTEQEIYFAATGEELHVGPALGGPDLLRDIPLPLGLDERELIIPNWAPLRPEVVELGRILFFDPRLSRNGEVSCATCHDPELAWTDGLAVGRAIDGGNLRRATPTIFNRALSNAQFWDSRAPSVEAQALTPIGSPAEMGFTIQEAVDLLASSPRYVELFEAAFGRGPDPQRPGQCPGRLRTLTVHSGESPVDRFEAGEAGRALRESAQRGRAGSSTARLAASACHNGSNYSDELHARGGLCSATPTSAPFGSRAAAPRIAARSRPPPCATSRSPAPTSTTASVETLEDVVTAVQPRPRSMRATIGRAARLGCSRRTKRPTWSPSSKR